MEQQRNKEDWYKANDYFWQDGGYGGSTDDEAMIGDEGGEQDGKEGLSFLDRFLHTRAPLGHRQTTRAVDAGAGVGRITKHVLLKRFDCVHLIEADCRYSKRSRQYLGKKRSDKCTFSCTRIEDMTVQSHSDLVDSDLVWLQWTLQYLTDRDAVHALQTLAACLVRGTGVLLVKENRPYGGAREDRFQMETPACSGRYDITRTDNHHRLLFQRAGLTVDHMEEGVETNTYALTVTSNV